jgi:hypothetical protein
VIMQGIVGRRLGVAVAILALTNGLLAHQKAGSQPDDGQVTAAHQVMDAMADHHMHNTPHLRFTMRAPERPGDRARADAIVAALRPALEPYRDYRTAQRDGYEIFLPNVRQPMYHFTNYTKGFVETFQFRPNQPTALLYTKIAGGFNLVGAMYTAPASETEIDLDARVPLSIARWHAHVNICLPRLGAAAATDWSTFGPSGSISTPEACAAAGGRFFPQLFGWMVHVYPFERTTQRIWAME